MDEFDNVIPFKLIASPLTTLNIRLYISYVHNEFEFTINVDVLFANFVNFGCPVVVSVLTEKSVLLIRLPVVILDVLGATKIINTNLRIS